MKKTCPTCLAKEAEEIEMENEEESQPSQTLARLKRQRSINEECHVEWEEHEHAFVDIEKQRTYYKAATVSRMDESLSQASEGTILANTIRVSKGKTFLVQTELGNDSKPENVIAIVKSLYQEEGIEATPMAHLHYFIKGSSTILGATADPYEVFALEECFDKPIL